MVWCCLGEEDVLKSPDVALFDLATFLRATLPAWQGAVQCCHCAVDDRIQVPG